MITPATRHRESLIDPLWICGRGLQAAAIAKASNDLFEDSFLAQKHKLNCNCLTCGRILCTQEKDSCCPFCAHSLEESLDMSKLTCKVDQGKETVYGSGLWAAQQLTERLVEADRTGQAAVLDEAHEELGAPAFVKWATIKEACSRAEKIRQISERERETRSKVHLSALLGLERK